MYSKKSVKPAVLTISFLCSAVLLFSFFYLNRLSSEAELYSSSRVRAFETYTGHAPHPFINSTSDARPYVPAGGRTDALFYFEAPEGFDIISHSEHWDREMLGLLYHELKLNAHGPEIEKLNEVVVYPFEDDEMSALATYSPGIVTADFIVRFPAFPVDFSVGFPVYTGRIKIYGGDSNTSIESIAGSLSHEYGHHYTFYYMFDDETRRGSLLEDSTYGRLRNARGYGLIGSLDMDDVYINQRHKYLIETAAEDYVTLMGSPTTRQVMDYYDVRQLVENPDLPKSRSGERNAFPQENMSIPLAVDLPELSDYFFSFVNAEPRVPLEEKQDIKLDISKHSESFDLVTGPRTYEYYTITWNTPYHDAIYTIACYEPDNYSGWGYPIKTVHPGTHPAGSASAVIGEYAVVQGSRIYSMDDGLASGVRVFYVVAQLPNGIYYVSELYEVNFG